MGISVGGEALPFTTAARYRDIQEQQQQHEREDHEFLLRHWTKKYRKKQRSTKATTDPSEIPTLGAWISNTWKPEDWTLFCCFITAASIRRRLADFDSQTRSSRIGPHISESDLVGDRKKGLSVKYTNKEGERSHGNATNKHIFSWTFIN